MIGDRKRDDAAEATPAQPAVRLASVSRTWALNTGCLRLDLPLAGSPERSVWRCVVETADGRRFVLERIPSRRYDRKRRIAATLRRLVDGGLGQVIPYRPSIDNDPVPLMDHALWQLSDYVDGVAPERPAYTMDAWRGDAAAGFLIDLHRIASGLAATDPPFSIRTYIRQLFATLSHFHPALANAYRPYREHLERHLFPIHDELPIGFCHGDFHPLNVIWGKRAIRAVIDWEFCGHKPEIYDLANLLGCLGIEAPDSLYGPFTDRLVHRLQQAGIYSPASWQALPDLMLAIRFAWLGEWLRKNDREMLRMEADYMQLLLDPHLKLHFGGRFCR